MKDGLLVGALRAHCRANHTRALTGCLTLRLFRSSEAALFVCSDENDQIDLHVEMAG